MDKFEKHVQAQRPKLHKRRLKLGKRRTPGVTATKKSKVRAGMNERVLELETENKNLRAEIRSLKT